MYDRPHSSRFAAPSAGGRSVPRRWTRESFIPFRLEVLTPVFIGTGSDFSPLEYVIRAENGGHALHMVDTESWLLAAQDREDTHAALDRGDTLGLRRLMNEQLDTALYSQAHVPVPSAKLAKDLLENIKNPNSLSKAEIQPFVRNPVTKTALVPGSSLKGALSTPLIDSLDHGALLRAVQQGDKAYTKEMEHLLGNIKEHSMQALKVSDVPVPPEGTRIVAAVEVRREGGKPGTPKTPCEALAPTGFGGLPLYGRLLMDIVSGVPRITLPKDRPVSLTELARLCNAFYGKRFRDEMDKFYRLPHLTAVGERLQPVLRRIEGLNPERELLLRVGHYSHVECVTVSNNKPQARKGFGKTRTLADRELPFGWVVLSFCPEAEYEQGLARVEAAIATAVQERQAKRSARNKGLCRLLDAQRKLAEAAEQARAKAEEEQQRKERAAAERAKMLAALSPDERSIAEVAESDATEKQSMDLYGRLSSLDGDVQTRAASALRDCWQRLGKWEGKLSKKQTEKVAAVKRILEG